MQNLDVISVNIWQILASLANLLLLTWLAKKFLFKPVKKVVDSRRAAIDEDYAQAQAAREAAEEDKNRYAAAMATAKQVADQMIDRFEKIMKIEIRSHIEEIEIASPVTFARYMSSPQGSIYGYYSDRWDGMSSRLLANGTEPTVPGLFFVGAHGAQLSGFRPTYMSGDTTGKQVLGYVMGGGR